MIFVQFGRARSRRIPRLEIRVLRANLGCVFARFEHGASLGGVMRDECALFQGLGTPTGFGQGLDLDLVAACTLFTMTARDRCHWRAQDAILRWKR